jgi:hypothetical protein
MAEYVVAKRREYRGQGATAFEAVTDLPGVTVTGAGNPDRICVEGPKNLGEILKERLGLMFLIEPQKTRQTF